MEIYDEINNTSEVEPEWSKMVSKAFNAGYREGISSTEESLFQQGFDTGFEAGFQAGFPLGYIHGAYKTKSSSIVTPSEAYELKTIALKGNCQLCNNINIESTPSVQNIKELQVIANEQVQQQLKEKYAVTNDLGF